MPKRIDHRSVGASVLALSVTAVIGLGWGVVGCGGSSPSQQDDSDDMVGAPPSETDDPFRVAKTPKTAEEAETSGYLGADETDERESESDGGGEDEREKVESGEDVESDEESEPVAVRARETTPDNRERPSSQEGDVRCFSCVRICPIDEGGGADCESGERDVICGWGVHKNRDTAEELARAECDGALDMARQMESFSRIEGDCPPADCRSSSQ